MSNPTLKVSKTDAAKRQLETAIRLWFHGGEPLSIHTLAAAAHQVIHDLGKGRGKKTVLRNETLIAPKHQREFKKLVSKYENFLKHADRDPNSVLDFNPDAAEILMFDAVVAYEQLTHDIVPLFKVFYGWVGMHRPKCVNKEDQQKFIELGKTEGAVSKLEFLKKYQPLCESLGIK